MIPLVRDTHVMDVHCVVVKFADSTEVVLHNESTGVDRITFVRRITFVWQRENGSPVWVPDRPDIGQSGWGLRIERSQLPQWVLDLESEFKPRNLNA